MKSLATVVNGAVIGLCLFAGFTAGCTKDEPQQQVTATVEEDGQKVTVTSTVPPNANPAPPMVPESGRFTQAQAVQVKDGMSKSEVETIMGEPGKVQSNMIMGETEIVTLRWSNGEKSYIDVTFSNGRSAGKMAANLP